MHILLAWFCMWWYMQVAEWKSVPCYKDRSTVSATATIKFSCLLCTRFPQFSLDWQGVTTKVSTLSTSCRWPAFDCPHLAISHQVVKGSICPSTATEWWSNQAQWNPWIPRIGSFPVICDNPRSTYASHWDSVTKNRPSLGLQNQDQAQLHKLRNNFHTNSAPALREKKN